MTGIRRGPMFTTERMDAIFSDESRLRRLLQFEAALARAQARAGAIPEAAAAAIAERCRPDEFDVEALERDAAVAGTHAFPLVGRLRDIVGGDTAGYVHWGATSQDAVDTAMVLQVRDALEALDEDLVGLGSACAALAERHAGVPMAGRTLLQQAVPITFGLKAARWLAAVTRRIERLRGVREEVLVVQLGGAAGTQAAFGDDPGRIVEFLAEELRLGVPDLPWHAERDRLADLAGAVGSVAGVAAKVATDVLLLSQTEVGEVREGSAEGKGGSTAMPHKRNPVDATFAVASARLADGASSILQSAVHRHERDPGAWQAEWVAVPDLFRFTAGSLHRARSVVEGLEVDPARMLGNLTTGAGAPMTESLVVALSAHIARDEAQRVAGRVASRAAQEGIGLRRAADQDEAVLAALSAEELDRALDPHTSLGTAEAQLRRAVDRFRATVGVVASP